MDQFTLLQLLLQPFCLNKNLWYELDLKERAITNETRARAKTGRGWYGRVASLRDDHTEKRRSKSITNKTIVPLVQLVCRALLSCRYVLRFSSSF